jgi:hypothetical protein
MADPLERTERDNRLLRSLFSDEAIAQAAALEKSLEPDPAADPIARIDQEWIRESRRYTRMNSSGVLVPPDRGRLIGVLLLSGLIGPGGLILGIALGKAVLLCLNGFLSLFFFLPMLLALRQANKYEAAARAYRQRRAAALVALGRSDEAAPLPVVDQPVWVAKGVMDLESAITRLHDEYGVNPMGAQEYARSQAALLAAAPAHDRPFFEELNQLERDWAAERGHLTTIAARQRRRRRPRRRILPTFKAARTTAVTGVIASIGLGFSIAYVGAPPLMVAGVVLFGVIPLVGAWSQYRRTLRYQIAHAEYLRCREGLLSRRRWQQRSAG